MADYNNKFQLKLSKIAALTECPFKTQPSLLDVSLFTHKPTKPISESVTSLCIVVLFCSFLPGYALQNASRTAADYFDVK